MSVTNRISDFLESRGIKNAYQFQKATGLSEPTARRLFNKRDAYPSKETLSFLCSHFDAQPGDLLVYTPDDPEAIPWAKSLGQLND